MATSTSRSVESVDAELVVKRRRWNWNQILFAIHGWLGLSLGLPLFIICLSGSIAVLSHEIDWLFNPAIRAHGPSYPVAWQTVLEGVREEFPGRTVQSLWGPVGEGFAVEAWVRGPFGNERVYVEPTTGEVLGRGTWFNTQRFFRDFHRRFFWFSSWGITLVSLFAIPLLISVVTGLLFYKRWWAKLFTLRIHKGFRVLCADAHRAAGVWSFLFALIIAVTGVWYLVETPSLRAVREHNDRPERISNTTIESLGASARMKSLDELIAIAQEASPGFQANMISLPNRVGRPIQFDGQASAWFVRDRANRILLDPFTGDVLGVSRAEESHPVIRWSNMADPLHFGTFGGLPVKLLWFGMGLFLSVLLPTGLVLFIKRAEQKILGSVKKARREAAEASTIRVRLRGTGWLGCVTTTAVLAMAAWCTYEAMVDEIPERIPVESIGSTQAVGPWRLRVIHTWRGVDDERVTPAVQFVDTKGSVPVLRRAEFGWGLDEPSEKEWRRGSVSFDGVTGRAIDSTAIENLPMWLALETYDGERYVGTWPVERGVEKIVSPERSVAYWFGGWPVVVFCGGFLMVICGCTLVWYRLVWLRQGRMVVTQ